MLMASRTKETAKNRERDGASPGKIFVGGLAKDTTIDYLNIHETYAKHFGKYGEMTDYVIMKDKFTNQPRGFGFVTYADPSVVDKVIDDTHIISGRQVEIKRTIPRDSSYKDLKTRKIFIGGLPQTFTEDELKEFFSKYGNVTDHQIIRDHQSNRSRGFGFVVFDSEQAVDELLSNGQMVNIAGVEVEIKKAEPKKPLKKASVYGSDHRSHSLSESPKGLFGSYSAYGHREFGPLPPFRNPGGLGSVRFGGSYGDYGIELPGGYAGGYGYREEGYLGYPSRHNGIMFGGSLGGYRHDEVFGSAVGGGSSSSSIDYGSLEYGSGYGHFPLYGGGRGGYGRGGSGRYHPYGR